VFRSVYFGNTGPRLFLVLLPGLFLFFFRLPTISFNFSYRISSKCERNRFASRAKHPDRDCHTLFSRDSPAVVPENLLYFFTLPSWLWQLYDTFGPDEKETSLSSPFSAESSREIHPALPFPQSPPFPPKTGSHWGPFVLSLAFSCVICPRSLLQLFLGSFPLPFFYDYATCDSFRHPPWSFSDRSHVLRLDPSINRHHGPPALIEGTTPSVLTFLTLNFFLSLLPPQSRTVSLVFSSSSPPRKIHGGFLSS